MPSCAFTDTYLRGLKADSGSRQEATDTKCGGLVVRVTPAGVKTFCFKYRSRTDGQVKRLTIGRYPDMTLAQARSIADDHRKSVVAGRDPVAEKSTALTNATSARKTTFDKVAGAYIEQYAKPNKSSWKNDESYLKRPKQKWGKRAVSSITDDDAAILLEEIAATAPVSANRTQSVLHKMFEWAKGPGRKFVVVNPLAGMPRRAKEKKRERVLTDTEIKKLWLGLDDQKLTLAPPLKLALKMILCTMARPGEVAGAERPEFESLNGKKPEWHLVAARVKNRRPFIYPLSALAAAVVKEALVDKDQLAVFPSKWSNRESIARHTLSQATLDSVLPHIGVGHFTPHDLRRTAATISRRAGAPRDGVDALLNHTKTDVTAVYDLYDMLTEKRAVAEILQEEILRIVGTKRPVAA